MPIKIILRSLEHQFFVLVNEELGRGSSCTELIVRLSAHLVFEIETGTEPMDISGMNHCNVIELQWSIVFDVDIDHRSIYAAPHYVLVANACKMTAEGFASILEIRHIRAMPDRTH